ncbi:replication initiator protein RctB domain-containing protein [Vibrio nigripulchritudo]|uniref:replication initiator protein RctB domain-containing protein n=1 Tax=Vibrio nigripulchritudo TaxID=28173 RepID=UPI002490C9F4|nr:replication initiator protein RctB domain-containing protein [Vibrio nigripulchritudo]BDU41139.1 hypothetical protein TUMSATVNIG2_56080 [Vibrio nigripulchritudo]BDU46879.1 hypothetical protein TUMSATVNIG3_56770 [Vibrio nigripulchritudo]
MTIELTDIVSEEDLSFTKIARFTIFVFDGTEQDKLYKGVTDLKSSFSPAQISCIYHLLLESNQGPILKLNDFCKSRVESEGVSVNSTRRHIKELVELKVLIRDEVTINGELKSSSSAYRLNTMHNIHLSIMEKKQSKGKQGNNKAQRESTSRALNAMGYTKKDLAYRSYLSAGYLIPKDVVPTEYQALAPAKRSSKNFRKIDFMENGFEYRIEAKAHDHIVTQPALLQLYALINLAISYNAKMLSTGKIETPFQNKAFPAHYLDILHLRGQKDSGQARQRVLKQITELRETQYRWVNLQPNSYDHNMPSWMQGYFSTSDFQYIVKLETNSTVAPKISAESKETETSPVLYFITFHDDIIEKIANADIFFSIPWRIAQSQPLIFSFYMTLRKKQVSMESILLTELREMMAFAGTIHKLRDDLEMELNTFYSETKENAYSYNLCGYYIKFNENQVGEWVVNIYCDIEEMVRESGATYKSPKSAPTLPNPLKTHSKKAMTVEEMTFNTSLEQLMAYINTRLVIPHTKRYKLYKIIKVGDKQIVISGYTTDSELEIMAEFMADELNIQLLLARLCLMEFRKQFQLVGYKGQMVSVEQFQHLFQRLKSDGILTRPEFQQHNNDLIAFLEIVKSFRRQKFECWLQGQYELLISLILQTLES